MDKGTATRALLPDDNKYTLDFLQVLLSDRYPSGRGRFATSVEELEFVRGTREADDKPG